MQRLLFIFVLLCCSACNFFAPAPAQQTLQADHALAVTSLAFAQATATARADVLMLTLENASTAVRNVDNLGTRIAATMIATGSSSDSSLITPPAVTAQPNVNFLQPTSISSQLLVTPMVTFSGSASGNSTLAPTIPPTPNLQPNVGFDPNTPRLQDLATSTNVGTDDCPLDIRQSFSQTIDGVYVSARATNLPDTATIISHWNYNGTTMMTYDWSPGFAIADACIWFYLPTSDVDFAAGAWTVELLLDGVLQGSPISFTVMGDDVNASAGFNEPPTPIPSG